MLPSGLITLLTDFGIQDAYVGVMKGVILSVNPAARIVDLTHEVPPQDVIKGAFLLRSAAAYFPDGTVHVAVVDPGVGTERRPVVVVTKRAFLVGPDNGLLTPSAAVLGVREVRRLEQSEFFRHPVSQTFHGRDVFAPVAAHLAAGVSPDRLGPIAPALQPLCLPEPRRECGAIHGEVLYVDRFGNLITNVPAAQLAAYPPSAVCVSIAGVSIAAIASSYAAVPRGAPLAVIGSAGLLEIAVRDGNAAEELGAGVGTPITVRGT